MIHNLFRSTGFWLFSALILHIIIYNRWFFSLDIFTWGDWGFFYQKTVQEWLRTPQIWNNAFLGGPDLGLSLYIPATLFFSLLAQFSKFAFFEKIVFFFPSVIVPTISIFLLVKEITKNNISAFVSTLIYNLNTYTLLIQTGHLTLSTAYAFGPLVFLLFRKTLMEKSLFYALLTGLVGAFASFYEVRGFYVIALILFFYCIYTMLLQAKNKKNVLSTAIYSIIPIIIVGLLNIYWILGFLKTSSAYAGIVLDRGLVNIHSMPIYTVFTLFLPSWTGSHRLAWGELQQISYYFWLIPFIAFTGFWLNRKNKEILFWTIIGLLGIFLTKSAGEPFGNTYAFLYTHFPGFSAFRDSSKFFYYVCLSYSILIGAFTSWILSKKYNSLIKYIIIFGISSIFLYNAIPVFKGELARLLTPRHIPDDYRTLKEFTQKQNKFFRVLYVPDDSRWGYWDSLHPKLSIWTLIKSDWAKLNNYQGTGDTYAIFDDATNIFRQPYANKLLDASSVKYVVVPIEDKENEEVFIFPPGVTRQDYVDFLNKLSYLKKINIGTKELAVFENKGYFDHFTVSNGAKVKIIKTSPTKYELIINTSKETTLLFSENFHTDWKLRVGNFNWIDTVTQKDYFLSDSYHKKTDTGLNSFIIKPEEICNNENCIKKNDSSYEIRAWVYFKPQSYVNLGSIVSLSVLLAVISFIIVLLIEKRKHGNNK